MPVIATALCIECYTQWITEMQTVGSSNIKHYFLNSEIESHLQENYDPIERTGHSMGATFIWGDDGFDQND